MKRTICGIALVSILVSATAIAGGWDPQSVTRTLANGQPKQALSAIKARLTDHPNDPQARFFKAMALADTGELGAAVGIFKTLSMQYPQRAEVWNDLGVLYARQGRFGKARSALLQAIARGSNDGRAEENLGDVYIAMADAAYRQAERSPGEHAALVHKLQSLKRLMPSLPVSTMPVSQAADRIHPAVSGAQTDKSSRSASSNGADTSTSDSTNADGTATPVKSPKQPPDNADQAIHRMLTRWANAQSQHDASAYLSVYSSSYHPNGQQSLPDWIRQQRAVLGMSKDVTVSAQNLKITHLSDDKARVQFSERRQTARGAVEFERRMLLVREDGNWRIRQENPVSSG